MAVNPFALQRKPQALYACMLALGTGMKAAGPASGPALTPRDSGRACSGHLFPSMTEALPPLNGPILTERLRLRPFTLEDAPVTHRWFSDPEVMHHIPGGPDATLEDTQNRISRYLQHGQTHGFTKWLVTDRTTGELLGDGGLYTLPNDPRVELGFRFAREHWGHGYATEMARAWMEQYAMMRPDESLYGIVLPDHVRSQHVLEKLGFEPVGEEQVYGRVMKVYLHPHRDTRSTL